MVRPARERKVIEQLRCCTFNGWVSGIEGRLYQAVLCTQSAQASNSECVGVSSVVLHLSASMAYDIQQWIQFNTMSTSRCTQSDSWALRAWGSIARIRTQHHPFAFSMIGRFSQSVLSSRHYNITQASHQLHRPASSVQILANQSL